MSKIRVLPESLANKIAAGEVVERPSSVVKELLENALDARARRINLEIENGGKRLIRIVDDGEGMSRDDAVTAFERHATSKLRSAEDLEAIATLGFRGEALPSIASVSRLFLRTGAQDQVEGTEVEFNGGKLVAVRDIAWPGGTEVEVKELFFNLPARRKFLKGDSTEAFHIANLIQHYALANPDIAFLLIKDGRDVIRAAPAGSLKERAYQILGGPLLEKLNEVDHQSEDLRIHGFVSNPQEQRSSRDSQYLFVNGRFVRDQLIGRALTEAYRSMMPSGTYPAAILFIDLPSSEVDVNVHPAKTEVRFLNEGAILSGVRAAISRALSASQTITRVPEPRQPRPEYEEKNTYIAVPDWTASLPGPNEYSTRGAAEQPRDTGIRQSVDGAASSSLGQSEAAGTPSERAPAFQLTPPPEAPERQADLDLTFANASSPSNWKEQGPSRLPFAPDNRREFRSGPERYLGSGSCDGNRAELLYDSENANALPNLGHGIKPLGQIRDSYIVATDEEGLLLIDQHVAHERILFEQFRDAGAGKPSEIQPLLIPQTLDLSPSEAEAFNVVQEELEGMGIEAMQLSGRTIAVKTTPSGLTADEVLQLVRELLSVVEQERRAPKLDHIREEIAASVACKAAIKVNMPLTQEKMLWLIDELFKTANPMTCPHGRPILMRFSLRDIERGFKRP
jgi:DNA mismatch repair protein MutL